MKYDYHIAVIGAGSGGLVVASSAATLGAKVALIEEHKMGGDCLNYGCVPSKAFLKAAHMAKEITGSKKYGITTTGIRVNMRNVMKYVQSVIQEIEPHDSVERYSGLGVDVIRQRGVLLDAHTVKTGAKTITARNIVVATGAEAVVPPIPGIEKVPYLTNKNIFSIKNLPKHLVVLGAGPIGLELGQGFRHLGSKVTIVDMAPILLGKDDPEVSTLMEKVCITDGISLFLNSNIIELQKKSRHKVVVIEKEGRKIELQCDQVLVSLGRKPLTQSMGLEDVGVKCDERGYIRTNQHLQTSVKNIYACGDVVGPYQFTHMAGYQAGVVTRNIVFPFKKASVDYSAVPWVTYTRPEVAHAGMTEQVARDTGLYKNTFSVDLHTIDRALAEDDRVGFIKLITGSGNRIIGATIVGNKAGELIPLAIMAINRKMKAASFLSMVFPYPTQAEMYKFASLDVVRTSFKPWMKRIVRWLFF